MNRDGTLTTRERASCIAGAILGALSLLTLFAAILAAM